MPQAPNPRRSFFVADLDARGDLHAREEYTYEQLEQIPNAADLIAGFSAALWRSPDQFEIARLASTNVEFRWRASADSAGIATLRSQANLASLSLLASGISPDADQITLAAFQRHLLNELHDTGFEPSFDLMSLTERPLIATINFRPPDDAADRMTIALADRCFAASYFRYQGLA